MSSRPQASGEAKVTCWCGGSYRGFHSEFQCSDSPPAVLAQAMESLVVADFNAKDMLARMREREEQEEAAKAAYLIRPCANCGLPWNRHVQVHKPFDSHTVIGPSSQSSPLVVLCPSSVFAEPRTPQGGNNG